MLCNAVDDVLDGLGGGRGGVAAGMALKLAKKDKTAGLRRQPVVVCKMSKKRIWMLIDVNTRAAANGTVGVCGGQRRPQAGLGSPGRMQRCAILSWTGNAVRAGHADLFLGCRRVVSTAV